MKSKPTKKLSERITPGSWIYRGPGTGNMRGVFAEIDGKFWCVASTTKFRVSVHESADWQDVRGEAEANAELIAKAPALLRSHERLEDALRGLREALRESDLSAYICTCNRTPPLEKCPIVDAEAALTEAEKIHSRSIESTA